MSAGDEMDAIISGSGASGGLGVAGGSGGIPQGFDAENAQNDEGIEMQFAVMCMEQAEVYFGLITKIKPSELKRLTKWDDEIVEAFLKAFPEYDDADKLRLLSEDEIKSPGGKRRWREFMMPFADKIDEYNFGTLIRLDCTQDYTQANSMFGYRLQFYALEILRNRKGLNDAVWQRVQDDPDAFAESK
ncbi:hypothetical protein JCM3770_000981 [Rhodotorula araucariae]